MKRVTKCFILQSKKSSEVVWSGMVFAYHSIEQQSKRIMKVWVRLGGFITADAKTMADINNGYENALIDAIKKKTDLR